MALAGIARAAEYPLLETPVVSSTPVGIYSGIGSSKLVANSGNTGNFFPVGNFVVYDSFDPFLGQLYDTIDRYSSKLKKLKKKLKKASGRKAKNLKKKIKKTRRKIAAAQAALFAPF